jgi:hypothetical protein
MFIRRLLSIYFNLITHEGENKLVNIYHFGLHIITTRHLQ